MAGFDEWKEQQEGLEKAPASGGVQSPIAPGFGMIGQRATASFDSWRPAPGTNNNQTDSKYSRTSDREPLPFISDVDMNANWYSPMQPVWPFGPPTMDYAREWDYPTGYNLNFIQQRQTFMAQLRGMRSSWGVLATIIETRKDQLIRVPWTVQVRGNPRKASKGVEEVKKFLKSPDGKLSYIQWTRKLLDDLLVLDAPSIYFDYDRAGRVRYAEVIDGATIFPLIDDAGRRPDAPQPAFQQIIKGLPMRNFDETQLMYVPMHVRPDVPIFGYPGTEQILIEASEAIRKTFYQLSFWAEGTIPDLIVTVPDSWTPRQIAMFQAHTDALLSGNLTLKSKIRYLPGGMKPFDVKNANGESLWSQRDETLIRLACYAYSVSPTPFVKQTNRSVAQNAQQSSEEEGLYPLMSYWKDDIMDPVIDRCGYDDIEFIFLPRPEPDAGKQATIHQIYAKEGILSRNEIRAELGREPEEGGDIPMVELGNIIVPVSSAAQGQAASANPQAQVSSANGKSGDEARNPAPAEGQPLRGPAKPNHQTSNPSVKKAATAADVEAAAQDANGDVDANSALQLTRGNYKMGHVWMHGLNISIENSRGSKRGKKNKDDSKRWESKLPAHYGYIRGTLGADGDQIDVFLGEHPESRTVWVIDQHKVSAKGKLKDFDEHKVMLGFDSLASALKTYLTANAANQGLARISAVTELSITDFKSWLNEGETHKPLNESGFGTIVVDAKMLRKADTISASTGLSSYSQLPAKRKRKKRNTTLRGPRWLSLSAEVR